MKHLLLLLLLTPLTACGSILPAALQTPPAEVEQVVMQNLQTDFLKSLQPLITTPEEMIKCQGADPSCLSDATKATLKSMQFNRLEAKPGDLSQDEKNDGYNDAWCMKYEATADAPTSQFAHNGKIIQRYAYIALKKFQAWDAQLMATWSLSETENGVITRCNMRIVVRKP